MSPSLKSVCKPTKKLCLALSLEAVWKSRSRCLKKFLFYIFSFLSSDPNRIKITSYMTQIHRNTPKKKISDTERESNNTTSMPANNNNGSYWEGRWRRSKEREKAWKTIEQEEVTSGIRSRFLYLIHTNFQCQRLWPGTGMFHLPSPCVCFFFRFFSPINPQFNILPTTPQYPHTSRSRVICNFLCSAFLFLSFILQ